jgi:hypothetical protein
MTGQNGGHGPCVGCGREVVLEPDPLNQSAEGVVKAFDNATYRYVTWHRSCLDAQRAGETGVLLPEPPRRRRRANEDS